MQNVWRTEDGGFCTCTIDPNDLIPDHAEKEAVNHPAHYNQGRIEVIDFIDDQSLGFALGNAVKYICRCAHKGKRTEDLRKAVWYIEHEIEREIDAKNDDQD